MKADFMTDITDKMKDDPNIGRVSPNFKPQIPQIRGEGQTVSAN
jgi:hypothetical protein